MEMGKLANPFNTWAELALGLRQRYVAELGSAPQRFSPYRERLSDELLAMGTLCTTLGATLQGLHFHDPEAYDAFLRALETS